MDRARAWEVSRKHGPLFFALTACVGAVAFLLPSSTIEPDGITPRDPTTEDAASIAPEPATVGAANRGDVQLTPPSPEVGETPMTPLPQVATAEEPDRFASDRVHGVLASRAQDVVRAYLAEGRTPDDHDAGKVTVKFVVDQKCRTRVRSVSVDNPDSAATRRTLQRRLQRELRTSLSARDCGDLERPLEGEVDILAVRAAEPIR